MPPSELAQFLPARYLPVRHLADGGMASVWVSRDTLLDREVAVKLLAPSLAADDDARARFTREAHAAARLSAHPHVVTVYDAGEHEGRAYLVMALYPGGTVADRVRGGRVERAVALRWLHETAEGLDAAHEAGVVHRDVKPANLLLDERDRVAVGDFGIATAAWAASVTRTGLVVGTMAYLAPEQKEGRAATPASDRYALGVVAHELLTGARLLDAGIDPALPTAVRDVIARVTSRDEDERHPSARAFVADLERALGLGDTADRTAVMPAAGAAGAGAGAVGAAAAAGGATPPPTERASSGARTPKDPRSPRRDAGVGPGAATASPRRPIGPVLLAVALLALVGGATAALLSGEDGAPSDAARTSAASTGRTATTATAATTAPAQTAAPATAATPTPAPVDDPKALNDAGFALYNDGRYAEALPLLEQAVAGLESTPEDIYYAFALYNLATTLHRLGRPADAIPYLERRLEVSDFKRGVVQKELDSARADAGLAPAGKPGKGKKDKDD